ncbi:MAG TPA: 2-dehydropantoate 2-reductase [Steroidobacteraceae bacterium]|nr:2-dehydropantoate 2-reductase [Steroidobacteraceae bacterium]
MRLLMLGAGGVGGYFGARLHEGGADVTFLVRAKRATLLRERGLRIYGVRGEFQIRPNLLISGESSNQAFDAVIVSCKAYDLDSSIDAIRPYVGATTLVLPLLNGLKHLDTLDAAFGKDRVLGGLAQVSTTIDANGDIKQITDTQNIFFGARSAAQDARAEQLETTLKLGGFEARLSRDILLEMWEKFVLLTSLAGMTCLMRGTVGEIAATQDGIQLMSRMLDDCAAVAKAAGNMPRDKYFSSIRGVLTQTGSPLAASMRRDLEAGGRTEADHIVGDMLKRADEAGIDSPLLRAAYCHLQVHAEKKRVADSGR